MCSTQVTIMKNKNMQKGKNKNKQKEKQKQQNNNKNKTLRDQKSLNTYLSASGNVHFFNFNQQSDFREFQFVQLWVNLMGIFCTMNNSTLGF